MTTKELHEIRKSLADKQDSFKKEIAIEFGKSVQEYIKERTDIERNKVYTVQSGDRRRNKYKRFVVYAMDVQFFDKHCLIIASGWWLNADSVPTKWANLTIEGVSNPDFLTLSEDQTNHPHPDAK